MGIYDRDYAGAGSFDGGGGIARLRGWSVNTWLIAINVAIFVIGAFGAEAFLRQWFSFSTYWGFARLEVWRLVSFQFLHANFLHLFFNMFGLYIFGGMVEQYLGSKRYAAFYLMCGICGGLLYLLLNLAGTITGGALPGVLDVDWRTPLIGASAGVFGVIVACARIAPNLQVFLIFPPVPLRLKWLAYGYVGIAALNLVLGGHNAGGDAAHLGGAIGGYFFIRNAHLLRDFFDVFRNSNKPERRERSRGRRGTQTGPSEAEIDRILAKVRASGLASLTEREKKTLERASRDRQAG